MALVSRSDTGNQYGCTKLWPTALFNVRVLQNLSQIAQIIIIIIIIICGVGLSP
jgi:hypothetical protein